MRLSLPDLEPGADYYVQVRANESGTVSQWSQLYTITATADVLPPSAPSALSWVSDGTAFVGTWTAPTTNSNGTVLADFKDYQVTVFSPANTSEKVVYYMAGTRFDFPFEVNANSFSVPRAQVTIEVRARDNSGNLSSVATATAANPAPSFVTGLVVTGGTGTVNSTWTPLPEADLKNYEVYMDTSSSSFSPGPANLVSVTTSNSFSLPAVQGQIWYVKVRPVDIFGTGSAAYASGSAKARALTDGLAPTSSPAPTVVSGIGSLFVRWTPIVNADPVKYEVHVSTTTGFTPSATTLVGTTSASLMTVSVLAGPAPAPGDPDTRVLQYGTTYYVKIIARDDDNAAAASAESSGVTAQVKGPDIAANAVTAEHVASKTFTGDEFAGTMFIGNTFKTAETGQRAEFGVSGYKAFKSNGDKKFWVTTDDSDSYIDGEFVARTLTVTGGASFQSNQNEVTATSALTLRRGVTSPSAPPQLTIDYDKFRFQPISISSTVWNKAFSLITQEVSHIRWKPGTSPYWIVHQIRSDGTRAWYYNPDGTPRDLSGTGGDYGLDYRDWEIWSSVEIPSGPKAGLYQMIRYIPNNTWNVMGPGTSNVYTRLNSGRVPALGTNGTDLFIAETVGASLKINYHNTAAPSGSALPAPFASHSSSAGYATSLCYVEYNSTATGGFDISGGVTHRYATAERAVNYTSRTIYQSGAGPNNLFPGSSGVWGSATSGAESWECPYGTTRCGMGWDGTNFWTYGADGYMYKHTSNQFDPSVASNKWWASSTFYDSKSAGTGFHETLPGNARSIVMARRANLNVILPTIPVGLAGNDDPDVGRLYMGRGDTQPTNANMRLQYEGSALTTRIVGSPSTSGAAAPTTNNFPFLTPAQIRNDDDTLVISGDASVKAAVGNFGSATIGGTPLYAPLIVRKFFDESFTSPLNALPPIVNDTELKVTVLPNTSYLVEFMLISANPQNTSITDLKIGFSVPSGSVNWTGTGPDTSISTVTPIGSPVPGPGQWLALQNSVGSALGFGLAGSTKVGIEGKGTYFSGATGGTFNLMWGALNSNTSTVVVSTLVYAGSYMKLTPFI